MRLRAAVAMLREQIIRTGWQLGVVVTVVLLCEWALYLLQGTYAEEGLQTSYADMYGFAPVLLAAILSGALLLVLYHNDNDLRLGLPEFVLQLPLPTWLIVLTRLTYNLAAMAVVLAITIAAFDWASDDDRFPQLFWNLMLVFLVAHVMAWSVGERGSFLITHGVALVALIWLFEILFSPLPSVPSVFLFLAVLPLAYAVCWYGIARQRRGARALADRIVDALLDWGRVERDHDFISRDAAQRWFEWRLIGGGLPAVAVVLTFFVCAGMWISFRTVQLQNAASYRALRGGDLVRWSTYRWQDTWIAVSRELVEVAASSAVVAAFVSGTLMFLKHIRLETGTFLFTRPMSTRALAKARFTAVARNVVFTGAFVVAAALIALVTEFVTGTRPGDSALANLVERPLVGTLGAGLVLVALLGWTWGMAWVHGFGLLALAMIAGATFARMIGFRIGPDEEYIWVMPGIFLTVSVLWALQRAYRSRVLDGSALMMGTGFAALVFTGMLVFTEATNATMPFQRDVLQSLPFLLLPLAPIALVPLSLHWMRHR